MIYPKRWLQCDPSETDNEGGTATALVDIPLQDSSSSSDDSSNSDSPTDEEVIEQASGEKIPIKPGVVKPAKVDDKDELIGSLDDSKDDGVVTKERLEKDKAQADIDKAAKAKQAAVTSDKPVARDYSIFGAEDSEIVKELKKAPNHIFAAAHKVATTLSTRIKELEAQKIDFETKYNEISKGVVKLPDNYRTHPQAYIHDPSYSTLRFNIGATQRIKAHYLDVLDKIENGDAFQDIKEIKDDGSFVLSDPIEAKDASNRTKELVREHITNANVNLQQFNAQVEELKRNHITEYTELKTGVHAKAKEFFPWIGDEKLQETKINILNPQTQKREDISIKSLTDKFRASIPKSLHQDILFEPLVNSLVANVISKAAMGKTEEKKQVTQQLEKDKAAAETVDTGKGGGNPKAADSDKIGSLSDMRSDD